MSSYEEGIRGARGILQRLLPGREQEFFCELIPPEHDRDVFEIETVNGRVVLRGSNGLSLASALNWFLKYRCSCDISWHSSQLNVPNPLPSVEKIRIASPYKYRYYFNYCTFSYSSAFWDWPRWEREIDWMALNGINMPLAITGQEAVWQAVYRQLGLTDDEIRAFLVGPAYLPFGWMGCIDGWGGPLPQQWIDRHVDLQKRIVDRERELGITPVLQGFTGHVPAALARMFPGSRLHTLSWAGFPDTYFLDPTDPLFIEIGELFIQEQTRQFGTDHLYAADSFIEMQPQRGDPDFLASVATSIHAGMTVADPKAIWVMQAWPFFYKQEFWQLPQIGALLGAVPDDRMILLDLFAEQHPMWRQTEAFYGKPWIWCMLQNFGGRPGLFGRMLDVAIQPPEVLTDSSRGSLSGIGVAPEAIEQNPALYELMTEMAWHAEPVEPEAWIREYAQRRYGGTLPEAERAWTILEETVYSENAPDSVTPKPVICQRPDLERMLNLDTPSNIGSEPSRIREAWRLLLDCADQLRGLGTYQHDVVDVASQALSNVAESAYAEMGRAYEANSLSGFRRSSELFLHVIRDLDSLLASREERLLGRWIADARSWATSSDETVLYEWNARNLITLWGPRDSILHDYSCRFWSGLLSDFYLPRWEMFIHRLEDSLSGIKHFSSDEFTDELKDWEERWTHSGTQFPVTPAGDSVEIAQFLFDAYP